VAPRDRGPEADLQCWRSTSNGEQVLVTGGAGFIGSQLTTSSTLHVTRAREALGFEAEVPFEQGLTELAEWLEGQAATDRFDEAAAELDRRGLTA
jgi:dTDP-D-glucose 4,6-dehydratase